MWRCIHSWTLSGRVLPVTDLVRWWPVTVTIPQNVNWDKFAGTGDTKGPTRVYFRLQRTFSCNICIMSASSWVAAVIVLSLYHQVQNCHIKCNEDGLTQSGGEEEEEEGGETLIILEPQYESAGIFPSSYYDSIIRPGRGSLWSVVFLHYISIWQEYFSRSSTSQLFAFSQIRNSHQIQTWKMEK